MIKNTELSYAAIDELYLDPLNPRVGRHFMGPDVSQEDILDLVSDWALDELAYSYLDNGGFWLHEALLVIKEELYGEARLIVIEGNRRLAALKYLKTAFDGNPIRPKWTTIISDVTPNADLFTKIPYILVQSREEVQAFLGFRHVTGIKQWDADEKAFFIANMIDSQKMTYEEVMRKIGSTTSAVRRHYIAYRVLLQIEENVEDFDRERADESFTILYMTLDTLGAKTFLSINIKADPRVTKTPVPESHMENLAEFARWLYGTAASDPIIKDTRQVSKFGKALESEDAILYLKQTAQPSLEFAYQKAGGEEDEILKYIMQAADNIEYALSLVHHYSGSLSIQKQVKRVMLDAQALGKQFPEIAKEIT
jgi:hypothetical protein